LIVRLIRGEEAKEESRMLSSAAALITFSTLTSAAEARELTSLREAAVEMRGLSFARTIQDELRVYPRSKHSPQAAQLVFHKHQQIVAGATLSARAFVRESAGHAVVAPFAASS
jgi:hypothetical protein